MEPPRPGSTNDRIPLLIGSWLDARHVARIEAAEPERIELMYEPALLPVPRYRNDHHGTKRSLSPGERARWAAMLARAQVLLDIDWEDPATLLQRAPNLRWVQSTSSGIGPMLVRYGLAGTPLVVTNAAGIHAQPLAEFVLMSAIHFAKDMPRVARWKGEHHWERYCGSEAAGSRMLVIGLGAVGTRIAELCSAIGMDVVGCRHSATRPVSPAFSRVIDVDALDAELAGTDYLALAAPETAATRHLIDRRRLDLLPRRAVVVNVGRGSLIDEPALIDALAAGSLRGAALDVFATEPLPVDSPLWDLPNVIVSPHSASTVWQENDRIVELFVDNLHRFVEDRPLRNVFDHSRL